MTLEPDPFLRQAKIAFYGCLIIAAIAMAALVHFLASD
jgi:hypothetical protein